MADSKEDMKKKANRFLAVCGCTLVALGVLVAAFNVFVDPYMLFGRPRITGFNAKKPSVHDQLYLVKAYDVFRARPKTILLGSSGVAIGLDARSPEWPADMRPVYNLALLGGSTSSSFRYLQHALTEGNVRLVMIGVDFRDLLAYSAKNEPTYEKRLAVNRNGSNNYSVNRQRLYDVLFSSLSFDASIDSARTLIDNIDGESSNIESGDIDFELFRESNARFGPYPTTTVSDIFYSYLYRDGKADLGPINDISSILKLCHERGIKLVIIVEPAHADELEMTYLSGKWAALESWKRQLATLVAHYSETGGADTPELWDFYEYDGYSTVSPENAQSYMRWFLTPTHYTQELGDRVIGRVCGLVDPSFGIRLTPSGLEVRLADIRLQQAIYHSRQPSDVARMRDIYNLVRRRSSN